VTLFHPDLTDDVLGDLFRRDVAEFTETTGIAVRLVSAAVTPGGQSENISSRRPPDLGVTEVGDLASLAREDKLTNLSAYLDIDRLRHDQSRYLVSLGTIGPDGSWPSEQGDTYGAFLSLNLKSIIWYPVAEFRRAGYGIPQTWDELIDLSEELRADGRTPWCVGLKSGLANGWPGTDWIEELVLMEAGVDVYDQWAFHEIPFDSASVRTAFERLGTILFTDRYVAGDPARTSITDAQLPMVAVEPPGCWLYHFPTFAPDFLPSRSYEQTDTFPFPTMETGPPRGLLGGGTMITAVSDRPEVREVVRFLLSPDFGRELASWGGIYLPNRRFDLDRYFPFERRQAELLQAALAADTFRFDASDLMPGEIGTDLFWDAMMTFAEEGPESLDRILAELDAAWPDAP
jgi:alpha-glucoside transport system substrate-binding protein